MERSLRGPFSVAVFRGRFPWPFSPMYLCSHIKQHGCNTCSTAVPQHFLVSRFFFPKNEWQFISPQKLRVKNVGPTIWNWEQWQLRKLQDNLKAAQLWRVEDENSVCTLHLIHFPCSEYSCQSLGFGERRPSETHIQKISEVPNFPSCSAAKIVLKPNISTAFIQSHNCCCMYPMSSMYSNLSISEQSLNNFMQVLGSSERSLLRWSSLISIAEFPHTQRWPEKYHSVPRAPRWSHRFLESGTPWSKDAQNHGFWIWHPLLLRTTSRNSHK